MLLKNKYLEEQIAEYAVKHKENFYRLAYSYVKNADDALDIVQESVYKAISSMDSLKNPDYLKTWFYRIVVNTSLDFLRRQKRNVAVGEEILGSFDFGAVDSYGDFDLQRALDNLPEKYRTIVVLRYFEDLKIDEIAEILNENVNTVKTRLYKSLEILRVKLSECEEV
ncbi:MAG TPA: RNA polymerase subunit sigma-70 [Hungateiclostridium thermocellum]|uniref:RNA polymerase, sigma-24 subunit, ECF subfamily n=2 Tax=Acetivibrio thermocellus TaxID=1515 RepID=A3DFD9_ACET2|nr:sigma-70 family RNA polymerase sigma factor [Acetivibrio thermocellus]ABN52668.1 RNA polymerase, sigma-24 subunit, ECF subfamily [Acetivibrio thermocellus ATCC 27405]ADU73880.1 RNA polymerase, sigma-24 subunit, ECF subfamily [Acetivibrio thermocellus DSM 1313]ALX07819.1 RNA polymerase, sigma-24 subunit, RpoE, ECF subfamily [Acetivibrio thermocellus AD2]ANV75564.1 RNA polymerase, sigma-24 subunit, RpoE, ECF subfamily [Acetivibrio thermocellus DSM 2360]EIC03311.1 RNA polymerase sigma factor, 